MPGSSTSCVDFGSLGQRKSVGGWRKEQRKIVWSLGSERELGMCLSRMEAWENVHEHQ